MYWPLNDAHLVLFVLSCLPVITIGSLVSALTRVRRAEFVRLQNEVKQLSVKVKALEVAEQRRFLVELKSKTEGKDPLIAAHQGLGNFREPFAKLTIIEARKGL
jgi:hypothetical protein